METTKTPKGKEALNQFKVLSFDFSKNTLTNGMAWDVNTKRLVGKFNGEKMELKDGTLLTIANSPSYYTKNCIYSGYVLDLYPPQHMITESEYKGKKVTAIHYSDKRAEIKFENTQLSSIQYFDVNIEGVKRAYTIEYNPKDYITTVFSCGQGLGLDEEYIFDPLKIERVSDRIDKFCFCTDGGGYGEKYYVTSVGVMLDDFINRELSPYLSVEFKQWLEYGNLSTNDLDFFIRANWIQILETNNNWEVEVKSDPYEGGYNVCGFCFKQSALTELNKSLSEHISKFQGKTKIDWKEIVVTEKYK